jgi:hypothetical protein
MSIVEEFAAGTSGFATPEVSKRAVVVAVAKRGGPFVLEATIIPGVLFYVSLLTAGLGVAYVVGLAWMYGCLARRLLIGKGVPGVLVLGVLGITIRTVLAVLSGSAFIYFVQPVIVALATGGGFVFSLLIGRPLIGRIAHDFWPVTPEMRANPRIISLFKGLTVLWAVTNIVTAVVTLTLLLWLPLPLFLVSKQVLGMGITVTAIATTIVWSHRTACREGVVKAPVARTLSPA